MCRVATAAINRHLLWARVQPQQQTRWPLLLLFINGTDRHSMLATYYADHVIAVIMIKIMVFFVENVRYGLKPQMMCQNFMLHQLMVIVFYF